MSVIRKVLTVLAALLCLACITSCDVISAVIANKEEAEIGEKDNYTIYIWTDEATGVQYVVYSEKSYNAGFGGITPRLNPDGSLYGIKTDEKE